MNRFHTASMIVAASALALPQAVLADEEPHTDILLKTVDGSLRPFAEVDAPGGEFDLFQRVHEGELGEDALNFGDQPGFENFDLSTGSNLGFDLIGEARIWNGSGFDPAPATFSVGLFLSSPSEISVDTGAAGSVNPGFAFATHDGDEAHNDLQFRYNGATDPAIFLLELRIWTDQTGIGDTGSIFLVLNQGLAESEHEAATDYTVLNVVPAPAGAAAFGLAGVMALRRRRAEGSR